MLIQSKYRIDDKKPMDKDGKEKKPWSKLISKNSQQIESKNVLSIESELAKLKAEHQESHDILNEHQEDLLDYIKGKSEALAQNDNPGFF